MSTAQATAPSPPPSSSSPGPAAQKGGAPDQVGPDQVTTERLGSRLRRWRPMALAMCLLLVVTLATMWMRPQTSSRALAIDNPRASGTMALAELLRDEGITVTQATSTSETIASARPGMTVAVVTPSELSTTQRRALADSGADVVVIGSTYEDLTGLTRIQTSGTSSTATLEADCQDPDAQAARFIASAKGSLDLELAPDAQGCFPVDDAHVAYATETLPGGGTLRIVSDPSILTNSQLTKEGHAALGIRALGHHESLIWLDAAYAKDLTSTSWYGPTTPPWLAVLLVHLCLAALVLAVVRGRRLGALIPERLPAVVRSTETTVARGRLYRSAADRERAASALRRGSAIRLSHALGLGAAASRESLLEALTRATGMQRPVLDALLYGPAPANDQSLADLAVNLDNLESKAHSYD